MTHVLHLVKDPGNQAALEVIAQQARDPTIRLSVVLMQAAVDLAQSLPGDVYRLREGAEPRPDGGAHGAITHAGLLDLVFAADTVVTW